MTDQLPVRPKPGYIYHHARPCRGCGALIQWWETPNGKWSPHDFDGTSHFATCPLQEQFRKRQEPSDG